MSKSAQIDQQWIFDTVAKHLFQQGERSVDDTGYQCLYRSDNLKCAVGVLMSDKDYRKKYEGKPITLIMRAFPKHKWIKRFAPFKHIMHDLQEIHDDGDNWTSNKSMKIALTDLANETELNADILSGLKFPRRRT